MGFNSHSADIPSHFDEDVSFEGNAMLMNIFLSNLEAIGGCGFSPNFSAAGPRTCNSKKRFKLVTVCKYHKQHYGR